MNPLRNVKPLVIALLMCLVLTSGCRHALQIKNLQSYTNMGIASLEKKITIGMVPQTGNIHCDTLVKGVGEALEKYSADVLLPYNRSSSRKVDVVANISIQSDYKGSGWNFLVNFPGFLVFAPAWNGYVYEANYTVQVALEDASSRTSIDTFSIPLNLNIRHADMNRTWTEVSWLEVGAIALVGGIVFIQYDDNVSPLLAEKIKVPIGDYLAQEIVNRINNSGKFSWINGSLENNTQVAVLQNAE